jgi:uncharacterized membrane protein
MNTTVAMILLMMAVVVIVVLVVVSNSGPRVTQIDMRRDREKDSDDA